ncbi:MAG: MXAN_6577-like cysteine-rich protein [Polyangiales bacterium]
MSRLAALSLALTLSCVPDLREGPGGVDPQFCQYTSHNQSFRVCGGACVSLYDDENHCGACGRACPANTVCQYGACTCPSPTRACGSACVDVSRDPQNCGACGNACADGAACEGGRCACPAGLARCGDRCLDVMNDAEHCGLCDNPCGDGIACVAGSCQCEARGLTRCGFGCVDLSASNQHCGACFTQCQPGLTCAAGSCACPEGLTPCGGRCVTLDTDQHCGACGSRCGEGTRCRAGGCIGAPLSPSTGERLGTPRPTFRWRGRDATVDVCADRACAEVVASAEGASAGTSLDAPLAPGVYFWRLRVGDAAVSDPTTFRVDHRRSAAPGLLLPSVDLDADGHADVAVGSARGLAVYLGGSPLATTPARSFVLHVGAGTLAVAHDVDRDGYGDVSFSSPTTAVLRGGGAASAFEVTLSTIPVAEARVIGDTNGDGVADWAGASGGAWGVWYGPLTPATLFAPFAIDTDASTAAPVGDLDGDGRPDLLIGASDVTYPGVWAGFASAVGVDRFVRLPPAPRAQGFGRSVAPAGDVNGDGLADALAGLGPSAWALYLGGADAVTFSRVIEDTRGAALRVTHGDVDGDGFGDLVAVPVGVGELWVWRGARDGLAASPAVLRDARWAAVEAIHSPGDVDGDGLDDVVLGAPSRDAAYVLFGHATALLTRAVTLEGAARTEFGRDVL